MYLTRLHTSRASHTSSTLTKSCLCQQSGSRPRVRTDGFHCCATSPTVCFHGFPCIPGVGLVLTEALNKPGYRCSRGVVRWVHPCGHASLVGVPSCRACGVDSSCVSLTSPVSSLQFPVVPGSRTIYWTQSHSLPHSANRPFLFPFSFAERNHALLKPTRVMRTHAHVIAPALPLVYALRLSWAEPRTLTTTNSTPLRALAAFAAPFSVRRPPSDHLHPGLGSRLLPWAQSLPFDGPVTHRRRPRVLNSMGKDSGLEFPVSGKSQVYA